MSPAAGSAAHLQIIQNEKFYSRVLSKENSTSDPSFRVYYGGAAGSVPFLWESQPGTPKHAMADTTLPPLTPPPSYYSSKKKTNFMKSHKQSLFQAMLPRLRKPHTPPPLPPTASSSSSSSSRSHRRGRSSSSTLSSFSVHSKADEEGLSPTSTLCFGERRGCYSMAGVKSALLWIVGNGSGHGPAA